MPTAPVRPNREEVDTHEAGGHAVHRNWCNHCVAARVMENPHYRATDDGDEPHNLATIISDYGYMGEEDKDSIPLLIIKDSKSKRCWATVVDAKGATEFAVGFYISVLKELGYRRVLVKNDNEPAILALRNAVVKQMPEVEFIPRDPPTGDHKANGEIECMVREVKRQVRVLKTSTEEKLGRSVPQDHPLLAWMPRHGAFVMSRFRIGEDGKTPYERHTTRKWRRPMVHYGERIFFRPLKSYLEGKGTRKNDLTSKVMSGHYIGTHGRNADVMVLTKDGVLRGTSVHRMAEPDRWSTAEFDQLKGLPWVLRPDKQARTTMLKPMNVETPELGAPVQVARTEPEVRAKYITKVLINQYGHTPG